MSLMVTMEPIDEMPQRRRTGFVQGQADDIWRQASERPGPIYKAAVDTKRGTLESINRVLRAKGCIDSVVRCTERDDQDNPIEYTLFVRFDQSIAPSQPKRRRRRDDDESAAA